MSFIRHTDLPQHELFPGFRLRFLHTEKMTKAFVEIAEGSTLAEHSHPHEQITTVLQGRFEFTLNGETQILEEGMSVLIPSGVKHSGRTLTACKVVDAFSPPRSEYPSDQTFIVDYRPEHQPHWFEINRAWIEKDYDLEPIDLEELNHPQKNILEGGGAILIAFRGSMAAGTCALVNMGNNEYELIKMAVDEKFRGLKIGRQLCEATIDRARRMGAKKIILHSNQKTSGPAIALYRKMNFKEIPLGETVFQRADIKMELTL